jgi:hypothetical protein
MSQQKQQDSTEWKRFEDAVGKLLKAPPQHKPTKKPKAKTPAK